VQQNRGNAFSIAISCLCAPIFVLFSIARGAPASAPTTQAISRAELLAAAQLPELYQLPTPGLAIALPDDLERDPGAIAIRLSNPPAGQLSVRRVSHGDGRLYLEIFDTTAKLTGSAQVMKGERKLGEQQLDGSLWLSLKPRIGRLAIQVFSPGATAPIQFNAPTTLVEVRGRQIFLNGEPFLMKGATGQVNSQEDADYVHRLGLNTLRGLGAVSGCEQYGFMNLASLNFADNTSPKILSGSDEQAEQSIAKCLEWLKQNSVAPIDSPNTLILQLGNERSAGGDAPGTKRLTTVRRHVSQLLAAARNFTKPLAPALPVGYANQDLGFLTPDCMDVYMHNSFLDRDRYDYPWDDFLRWQGCLPPDGKDGTGRPFVNSEFGANRYLCQAYHAGPNNPFLEKLHAWNLPNRWAEFMEHGTVGGSIYCLHDLDVPRDQGCSCFGILTHDGKPKLACWDVNHMWRDFEIEVKGKTVVVTYKRDYWARGCRLTLTPIDGKPLQIQVGDFAPHSKGTIDLSKFLTATAEKGFRSEFDFTTHSGLPNKASGAWPATLEESDFLEQLKTRDTYPFLRELFDTEVLTADAKPAPRTLAEMTNPDGIIPVALRKRNGVTYLLLISRENPNKSGPLKEGITLDVAFTGNVAYVNDMTGEPLNESVDATPIPGGLRLHNLRAARIPGPIGQRCSKLFSLPIYRITPQ
jgi:hypothetical protein